MKYEIKSDGLLLLSGLAAIVTVIMAMHDRYDVAVVGAMATLFGSLLSFGKKDLV